MVTRRGVRDDELLDPRRRRVERERRGPEAVQRERVPGVARRDPPPHRGRHAQRGARGEDVPDRADGERGPEREQERHVPARGVGVLAQHGVGEDRPERVRDDDSGPVRGDRRGEGVVDRRADGVVVQVRPDVAREQRDDGAAQARHGPVERGQQQVEPCADVSSHDARPGTLRAHRHRRARGAQHLLGDGRHERGLLRDLFRGLGRGRRCDPVARRADRVHGDRRRRRGTADERGERVAVVDERRVRVAHDDARARRRETRVQDLGPRAVELLGVEPLVVAAVDEHESGHAPNLPAAGAPRRVYRRAQEPAPSPRRPS